LLAEADVLHLEAVSRRHLARRLEIDQLVDAHHGAETHEATLELRRLHAEELRELRHAHRALDAQRPPGRLGGGSGGGGCRGARGGGRVAALAPRGHERARIDRHRTAYRDAARHLACDLLLLAQVHHFAHALALLALAVRGAGGGSAVAFR